MFACYVFEFFLLSSVLREADPAQICPAPCASCTLAHCQRQDPAPSFNARTRRGFLESDFIKSLAVSGIDELEPLAANCSKVGTNKFLIERITWCSLFCFRFCNLFCFRVCTISLPVAYLYTGCDGTISFQREIQVFVWHVRSSTGYRQLPELFDHELDV